MDTITQATKASPTNSQENRLHRSSGRPELSYVSTSLGMYRKVVHDNARERTKTDTEKKYLTWCETTTFLRPAPVQTTEKKIGWKYRLYNTTYLPTNGGRWSTKLDYRCVSNRFKSMVIDTKVRWGPGPAIHRFGQKYDHGFLITKWRWMGGGQKGKRRKND